MFKRCGKCKKIRLKLVFGVCGKCWWKSWSYGESIPPIVKKILRIDIWERSG